MGRGSENIKRQEKTTGEKPKTVVTVKTIQSFTATEKHLEMEGLLLLLLNPQKYTLPALLSIPMVFHAPSPIHVWQSSLLQPQRCSPQLHESASKEQEHQNTELGLLNEPPEDVLRWSIPTCQ